MAIDTSTWPRWAQNLLPGLDEEERRILDCVVHHRCPKCGGSKPEGERCRACKFRYFDHYTPDGKKKP